MSSRIDRAYFAGFMDGEGSITACPSPNKSRWYIRVTVAQKNPETLYEMHELWGGSVINGTKHSRCYYWRVTGVKAEKFLRDVGPFLRLKYRQAQIAIWLTKHKPIDDQSTLMVQRLKDEKR